MTIETIDRQTYYRERAAIDLKSDSVDNAMRGRVEQFEILHNPPGKLVAYLGKPHQGRYPVTVWTGRCIGTATKGSEWGVNSYIGTSSVGQFYARIAGREYTGRGFGEGMCIALRETASSKRRRGAE